MELNTITAQNSIALQLLLDGKEQTIKYDHKTMLVNFMYGLRVPSPPVFSLIDCGDEFFKVSINLDLTFGDQPKCVIVEGLPNKDIAMAEENAVTLAFKHIDETEHIAVIDFSTKVSRRLFCYNTYGQLIDATDAVSKMVDNFRAVFGKLTEFAEDLESNQILHNSNVGKSSNLAVFGEVKNFIERLAHRFDSRVNDSIPIIQEIQLARVNEHIRIKEKATCLSNKKYSKTVVSSSKQLLDFVLSYFGFGSVRYTNGPAGNGMVEGFAMFSLPQIRGFKYCGNLTIKGKADSSVKAEEDAAFQALLLLEENFNFKIVDLNYSERVQAEQMQIRLVQLIQKASSLGESLKQIWGEMSNTLEEYCDHFKYELESLTIANKPKYDIGHYKYCMDGLSRVHQFSSQMSWHICFEQSDRLDQITKQLSGLKIKLGLP